MADGTIVLGILPKNVKCWEDDGKLRPMLVLDVQGSDAEIVPLSTNCIKGIHLVPNAENHLTRPCVVMGDTRLSFTDADRLQVIGKLSAAERLKIRKVLSWYPVKWRHTV